MKLFCTAQKTKSCEQTYYIVDKNAVDIFLNREGDNVSLACDANGYPPPHIVWRREDGEDILVAGKKLNIVEVVYFFNYLSVNYLA